MPLTGEDVRVDDVVAFRPPDPHSRDGRRVVHRVDDIVETPSGPAMRTRGDANSAPDPWLVGLTGAEVHLVRVVLPHAGRPLAHGPLPLLAVLGGIALLAAVTRRTTGTPEGCRCAGCAAEAAGGGSTLSMT